MGKGRLRWKGAGITVLAAVLLLHSSPPGALQYAFAQEEEQDLLDLTRQELQAEESDAVYAHLKIGDWMDYGDYGIERADIPGTDYFFYITTEDDAGNRINDSQLAYCVQSYFLTPLPGDHSAEMTDNVSSIGEKENLQKIFYYGYGGAGYDGEEFEEFLAQTDNEYYEKVYCSLGEAAREELSYILTHGAASYAYFTDGTPLQDYLKLQFEIRYGDSWEEELERFKEQELELAGIKDGDINLLGATYGMNPVGIALSKAWYERLIGRDSPQLGVTCDGDVYTFQGNAENEQLSLTFSVPENFVCELERTDGSTELILAGEELSVYPTERFSFAYTGETVSRDRGGVVAVEPAVTGVLSGTEAEAWNLVLLQMSKGTEKTISKRQQDIAAVSMTDAGRRELSFAVGTRTGAVTVQIKDDTGEPVKGAVLGVYYDEQCSAAVCQNGEPVTLMTDNGGNAYLEFVINQEIAENDGKLYIKEVSAPAGNVSDDTVYEVRADEDVKITSARKTTSVRGTVEIVLPEEIAAPEEINAELEQNGEVIDSKTLTAEKGWSYAWDDLPEYDEEEAAPYEYTVNALVPDGYVAEKENGQITVHAAEPAEITIEANVNLTGRKLKAGEFSFVLTQVTDQTGESAVPQGMTDTAVNEADGTVVFDGITCPKPGMYYFKVALAQEENDNTADGGQEEQEKFFVVQAEVKADPDDRGRLTGYVTYPEGRPIFEQTYEALGSLEITGIRVVLENGELEEGLFTFELRDEEGAVLQTVTNNAEGDVRFAPLVYTQADIGAEYVYTVSLADTGQKDMTVDPKTYTIRVNVEDSDSSDGTLGITQDLEELVFWGSYLQTDTEPLSETETEAQVQTDSQTQTARTDIIWLPVVAAIAVILIAGGWFIWRKRMKRK